MGFRHNKNRPKQKYIMMMDVFPLTRFSEGFKQGLFVHSESAKPIPIIDNIEKRIAFIGSIDPKAGEVAQSIFIHSAGSGKQALFFQNLMIEMMEKGIITIVDDVTPQEKLMDAIIKDIARIGMKQATELPTPPKPKFHFQKQLTRGKHNGKYNR